MLVSKSGTTLETLTNESFVKDALTKAGLDASKHMIAVTSETSPLAKSDDYLAAFFMDDYIRGRYSSCSGVGGAVKGGERVAAVGVQRSPAVGKAHIGHRNRTPAPFSVAYFS